VAISVDDQDHARRVWEDAAHRNVIVLSDPGAKVIREYGLLHPKGYKDQDIALRATLIVDQNGNEVFRQVSSSVPDVRSADQILAELKNIPYFPAPGKPRKSLEIGRLFARPKL